MGVSIAGALAGGSIMGALNNTAKTLTDNIQPHLNRKLDYTKHTENLNFQKDQFYNQAQHRMADYKKAGLNPYAVMGTAGGSQSAYQAGGGR